MLRTIQCSNCGIVLNLPPQSEGRKFKCPKCGTRFLAGASGDAVAPPAEGVDPNSTVLLSQKAGTTELFVMPTASGDLRETFDLPMMRDEAPGTSPGARGPGGSQADAAALFKEPAAAPRRKTGAEARAQARRCPTCGGVVPAGMSICQTCGLDLETNQRVGLNDDLAPPPPPRAAGMPIPIVVIGGLSAAGSVALAAFAFVKHMGGTAGAMYFVPVALFGMYAAVQFLRGKSVKLLLAALTMGAVINLVAMIGLPIFDAQSQTSVVQIDDASDDPEGVGSQIRPVIERLDTQKIGTGFILLVIYAAVSVYLLSPQVNRHFRK